MTLRRGKFGQFPLGVQSQINIIISTKNGKCKNFNEGSHYADSPFMENVSKRKETKNEVNTLCKVLVGWSI